MTSESSSNVFSPSPLFGPGVVKKKKKSLAAPLQMRHEETEKKNFKGRKRKGRRNTAERERGREGGRDLPHTIFEYVGRVIISKSIKYRQYRRDREMAQ